MTSHKRSAEVQPEEERAQKQAKMEVIVIEDALEAPRTEVKAEVVVIEDEDEEEDKRSDASDEEDEEDEEEVVPDHTLSGKAYDEAFKREVAKIKANREGETSFEEWAGKVVGAVARTVPEGGTLGAIWDRFVDAVMGMEEERFQEQLEEYDEEAGEFPMKPLPKAKTLKGYLEAVQECICPDDCAPDECSGFYFAGVMACLEEIQELA